MDKLTVYSVTMFDGSSPPRCHVYEDLAKARQYAWECHRELEDEWEVHEDYEDLAEEIPIWKGQPTVIAYGKKSEAILTMSKTPLRLG